MSESTRFAAEELLRAAASGGIPSDGDLLVRGPDGWFFGRVGAPSPQPPDVVPPPAGAPGAGAPPGGGGGGSISFADLVGVAFARQIVESSVTQHEGALDIGANQVFGGIFGIATPFPDLVYTFPNQMRRGLRTITAAATTYAVVDADWHINANISLDSLDWIFQILHNPPSPIFSNILKSLFKSSAQINTLVEQINFYISAKEHPLKVEELEITEIFQNYMNY